jgi:hypothetical protein
MKKNIFFLLISAVSSLYQHIFSKNTIEGVHKKLTTINHSNLIVCGDETCQIIKKYSIAENNTFNCFDENIMIIFELLVQNKTKIQYNGYLQPNHDKLVVDKQAKSEVCRKIKR